VTEDWVAVANAIKERVNELGWWQRELAQRSHVSQVTGFTNRSLRVQVATLRGVPYIDKPDEL
jgi:hypothetical protein